MSNFFSNNFSGAASSMSGQGKSRYGGIFAKELVSCHDCPKPTGRYFLRQRAPVDYQSMIQPNRIYEDIINTPIGRRASPSWAGQDLYRSRNSDSGISQSSTSSRSGSVSPYGSFQPQYSSTPTRNLSSPWDSGCF